MAITVRRVAREEGARLGSFAAQLFRSAYGPTHPEPTLSQYLARCFSPVAVDARLAEADRTFLVAEDAQGEWLGYAELRRGRPDVRQVTIERALPDVPAFEIVRFYVASRHHGRGVAQALMRACEHETSAGGGKLLWLQAWQEAAQALAFYRKVGFEIHGTAIFEFGEHIDRDFLLAKAVHDDASAATPAE